MCAPFLIKGVSLAENGIFLDHVAILVRDFEEALSRFKVLLSLSDDDIIVVKGFEDRDDLLDVAFLNVGNAWIEILSPVKPDGPMAKALEKRGEGLHHVCFSVKDLEAELKRISDAGFELIDKEPRVDRYGVPYFYVHPRSTCKALVSFIERWRKTGKDSWRPQPKR
ncbi:MAG: VOC family protein [Candidatus Nezhaarchaeales archaeon]